MLVKGVKLLTRVPSSLFNKIIYLKLFEYYLHLRLGNSRCFFPLGKVVTIRTHEVTPQVETKVRI